MIDANRFDLIRQKHGRHGSWAVWAAQCGPPKSNMGNLDVLDESANPALLETLKPGIVMIGLNVSRFRPEAPFSNFHDASPVANDFKIRFAFRDTDYWGAYMTDVIKDSVQLISGKLLDDLRVHPEVVRIHMETLREELDDLGHPRPIILAFGRGAHALLDQNLCRDEYSELIRLTHYSYRISKENYQAEVHQQILHAKRRSA